eukprot:TRINITY_DN1299_c0_g1_i1.p1 TRINITY_DN1299_c0_g1~~TRINITY_DN1299_c0_g1_i1.p1  ORF type:complete len:628 (-),score=103.46 TRINITY_DN1299_c0_g1_i1:126-2009(-)
MMSMIRDILMYMDKTYCKQQKKIPVYDMGLQLFRDHLVRKGQLNDRLGQLLLQQVAQERNGEVIDKVLMKNCLSMLVEVNVTSTEVYVQVFEKEFLKQTRTFYQQESQDFISQNTCPEYLRKIEKRIWQEENRADNYLDKTSKPKLKAVVQEELITKYAERLVEDEKTGCIPMFQDDLTEDLGRMYKLFSREPHTLAFVKETMSTLIRETGTKIVKDKENLKHPKLFVQHVLDTREKFNNFVKKSFEGDRNFARTLKEALEYFINLDSRAAQYLSLYIDDMLKKRLKGIPTREVEEQLTSVISIFRYLQDKDIFENFYKQHLANRLLTGQSGNAEVEKSMISKLKAECGHQFTSRLDGMFRDMDLSKQLMHEYRNWSSKRSALDLELSASVLTSGFWPIQVVPDCRLPSEASRACEHFRTYYTTVHSGRRLTWQTNLGTAEVRASFNAGRKELMVHTYQMCILMLYNHGDTFTYKEIQEQTCIPESELPRQLLSLAHPKVRVLRKDPNTKALQPDHTFQFNSKYISKLFRVKIPLLSQRMVSGDKRDHPIPPGVLEARKNRVEAAVVRVMKSRKTLDHNNLITEVVKQLSSRFAVDPGFIKKRIESLIEREYLERDKENRRVYHYLA